MALVLSNYIWYSTCRHVITTIDTTGHIYDYVNKNNYKLLLTMASLRMLIHSNLSSCSARSRGVFPYLKKRIGWYAYLIIIICISEFSVSKPIIKHTCISMMTLQIIESNGKVDQQMTQVKGTLLVASTFPPLFKSCWITSDRPSNAALCIGVIPICRQYNLNYKFHSYEETKFVYTCTCM